ncbi:MAG: hypothetical protein OER88_12390, partial [Planctomycetota bacterium]|nr:hypothetical protein [Planctomycetota bacterium]
MHDLTAPVGAGPHAVHGGPLDGTRLRVEDPHRNAERQGLLVRLFGLRRLSRLGGDDRFLAPGPFGNIVAAKDP